MLGELLWVAACHSVLGEISSRAGVRYSCCTYSLKEFGALDGKTRKKCFPSGLMERDWLHLLQLITEN